MCSQRRSNDGEVKARIKRRTGEIDEPLSTAREFHTGARSAQVNTFPRKHVHTVNNEDLKRGARGEIERCEAQIEATRAPVHPA